MCHERTTDRDVASVSPAALLFKLSPLEGRKNKEKFRAIEVRSSYPLRRASYNNDSRMPSSVLLVFFGCFRGRASRA